MAFGSSSVSGTGLLSVPDYAGLAVLADSDSHSLLNNYMTGSGTKQDPFVVTPDEFNELKQLLDWGNTEVLKLPAEEQEAERLKWRDWLQGRFPLLFEGAFIKKQSDVVLEPKSSSELRRLPKKTYKDISFDNTHRVKKVADPNYYDDVSLGYDDDL